MNLSGKAVNYWMQQSKIDVDNILVITDDISLPFGIVRMRKKGSDGGHNGLKDIQAQLSTSCHILGCVLVSVTIFQEANKLNMY